MIYIVDFIYNLRYIDFVNMIRNILTGKWNILRAFHFTPYTLNMNRKALKIKHIFLRVATQEHENKHRFKNSNDMYTCNYSNPTS